MYVYAVVERRNLTVEQDVMLRNRADLRKKSRLCFCIFFVCFDERCQM